MNTQTKIMKRITFIGLLLLAVFATSCTGNDGLDGIDGEDALEGQVIEVDGVDYTYDATDNLYSTRLTFSDLTNFEVLESDAILVYRYDGDVDLSDGSANNWSLIPQNFFVEGGTIQYVYAHNFVDIDMYIDGNFDLSTIDTGFTDNQFFRIVIIPGAFLSSKLDTSDMDAVLGKIGATEDDIIKVSL
jgi:hypothetical protein